MTSLGIDLPGSGGATKQAGKSHRRLWTSDDRDDHQQTDAAAASDHDGDDEAEADDDDSVAATATAAGGGASQRGGKGKKQRAQPKATSKARRIPCPCCSIDLDGWWLVRPSHSHSTRNRRRPRPPPSGCATRWSRCAVPPQQPAVQVGVTLAVPPLGAGSQTREVRSRHWRDGFRVDSQLVHCCGGREAFPG
jgi:hypothetical protein